MFSILLLRTAFAAPERVDSAALEAAGIPWSTGHDWVALPADSSRGEVVLVRDGTEAARVDPTFWQGARDAATAGRSSGWKLPPNPTSDDWRNWTRPPAGLRVGWLWAISNSPGSSTWLRQDWSGGFDAPWRDWVSVGLSGGMERVWTSLPLDPVSPPHDGRWWGWWGMRGCVRSLCVENRTSRHPLPDALRNQEGIDSLVYHGRDGNLARRWSAPGSAYAANWEQAVSLRLGVVSWRVRRDPEVWNGWSQEAALSPLPGGPLRWGLLAGKDQSAAWTGIVVGLAPWRRSLPRSFALSLLPPEVCFRYTDVRRFSLDIRSAFEIHPPEVFP